MLVASRATPWNSQVIPLPDREVLADSMGVAEAFESLVCIWGHQEMGLVAAEWVRVVRQTNNNFLLLAGRAVVLPKTLQMVRMPVAETSTRRVVMLTVHPP